MWLSDSRVHLRNQSSTLPRFLNVTENREVRSWWCARQLCPSLENRSFWPIDECSYQDIVISVYRQGVPLKWNDVELAVYLVFHLWRDQSMVLILEVTGGGKGRTAFCQTPPGDKTVKEGIDLHRIPTSTLRCSTLRRWYTDFFKVRKECLLPSVGFSLHLKDWGWVSEQRTRPTVSDYLFIKENPQPSTYATFSP